MEKILLIIPAFNEEASILKVCNNINEYISKNKCNDILINYVVINDGSTDKTNEICLENKLKNINLIHNLGIGGAVQAGYKYALKNNYDIAVQFDGDGQHDIEYLMKIVEPIIKGEAEFVIGSRFVDDLSEFKSSFMRRCGIKLISNGIRLFTGRQIKDVTSGFRAGNKKIIKEFSNHYPNEYPEPVTTVELLKKKVLIKEVGVSMFERENGTSSINSIYYMINVFFYIFATSIRRYK